VKVERFQTPAAGEVVGIELSCPDFDGESTIRYTNRCSEGCGDGLKLFVTPSLRGSTIHAQVCSGRYDFVRTLSREWWARKAAEVLGWDESRIREQIDPVWAMKMGNARLLADWKPGAGRRNTGHTCPMCGARAVRKDELCAACLGKTVKVGGNIDDLDNW
jgi:hypothetical protein